MALGIRGGLTGDLRWRQWRAYLAAGAISLLTLYVFARLQDYGPESAIRRFHAAIANQDTQELIRVTAEPIGSNNVRLLVFSVGRWEKAGWTYQLLRMERTSDQVRAAVVYLDPMGGTHPMIWIVERSGRSWRVNADKTMTVYNDYRDSLGLGVR